MVSKNTEKQFWISKTYTQNQKGKKREHKYFIVFCFISILFILNKNIESNKTKKHTFLVAIYNNYT